MSIKMISAIIIMLLSFISFLVEYISGGGKIEILIIYSLGTGIAYLLFLIIVYYITYYISKRSRMAAIIVATVMGLGIVINQVVKISRIGGFESPKRQVADFVYRQKRDLPKNIDQKTTLKDVNLDGNKLIFDYEVISESELVIADQGKENLSKNINENVHKFFPKLLKSANSANIVWECRFHQGGRMILVLVVQ